MNLIRIAYIYCSDTILDQTNQMTLQITKESLDRVFYENKQLVESQSRTSSKKASPIKPDARHKMDTEAQVNH
jgi:hypothetical protein